MSLDNLALIGPGSEWFWSMAQFFVVAITLLGIYRQVKLQASAAAIQQMDAITTEWRSEGMTRHLLAVNMALRHGTPYEEIPFAAASTIGDFWEGIAYLVRRGHIDSNLFIDNLGASLVVSWNILRPWTNKVRATGLTHALEDFEWLADRAVQTFQRRGDEELYDEPYIRRTLDQRIENDLGRIRVAEELRTVPSRSNDPRRRRPRAPVGDRQGINDVSARR